MTDRKKPNIVIEKLSLEKLKDVHEMLVESGKEWFDNGSLFQSEFSYQEAEEFTNTLIKMWENDTFYIFNILDETNQQVVGFTFLNHVNRQAKMANLGYQVRNSRTGEGIATAAAKLVATFGFEKLGFQRLEIVIKEGNLPSQKVADKLGAVREGLLRNRIHINDTAHDAYMYSLIPSDFGITNTAYR